MHYGHHGSLIDVGAAMPCHGMPLERKGMLMTFARVCLVSQALRGIRLERLLHCRRNRFVNLCMYVCMYALSRMCVYMSLVGNAIDSCVSQWLRSRSPRTAIRTPRTGSTSSRNRQPCFGTPEPRRTWRTGMHVCM
jgi:hypothetical protein